MSISIKQNCGFFSCCSVRLYYIINFFNSENILPTMVDSTESFGLYKKDPMADVTFDLLNILMLFLLMKTCFNLQITKRFPS